MEIDFITDHHKKTKRNYLERVNKVNKYGLSQLSC